MGGEFRVDGYQIVGLRHMDRKLIDAVVIDELRRAAAPEGATHVLTGRGTGIADVLLFDLPV